MIEVKAKLRYLRTAPRKVRLLADLIRGRSLKDAMAQVSFSGKKSSPSLLKLLKSAESNAKHNFKLDPEKLMIKTIQVDGGPVLKRYKPMSRGRASIIRRRSSHISVVLTEK
ncbi:MAG: 50S ribosomal protein L22 [Patescibacteria group bacterium]